MNKGKDYLSLTKPRTLLLHLPTVLAAVVIASGRLPLNLTLAAVMLGGGLIAASATTLNCYFDRDLDAVMPRTKNRPLPSGRLKATQALLFGIFMGAVGCLALAEFSGIITAGVALTGFFFYVVVYTLWLKRKTYWSSIIGSLAGAVPPVVGWVAVTNSISPIPLLIGAVIALWTPPHFWALAMYRKREYQSSGVLALPSQNVRAWLLTFSSLLTVVSLSLGWFGQLGILYYSVATVAGSVLIFLVIRGTKTNAAKEQSFLFAYSIAYLVLIFTAAAIGRLIN